MPRHLPSRSAIVLLALSASACSASRPQPATVAEARVEAAAPALPIDTAAAGDRRLVVETAELTIVTSDLHGGFEKAQRMAKHMGGYTLSATRAEGRHHLVLRVPAARFEEAVRRICKLGKVGTRSISGKDVTSQFVDLQLRLKNAEKMRERYLQLLEQAANVAEAVQVQKELERVTADIESMRGQLSLLANQISLATIRLTLEEATRPGPVGWMFYGLYYGVKWLFVWN